MANVEGKPGGRRRPRLHRCSIEGSRFSKLLSLRSVEEVPLRLRQLERIPASRSCLAWKTWRLSQASIFKPIGSWMRGCSEDGGKADGHFSQRCACSERERPQKPSSSPGGHFACTKNPHKSLSMVPIAESHHLKKGFPIRWWFRNFHLARTQHGSLSGWGEGRR